jgi:hypothetical protein
MATRKLTCRAVRSGALHPERLGRPYASSYTTDDPSSNSNYVSPMQDLFDTMKRKGPTSLGTSEFTPMNTKVLKCGVAENALRFTTTSYGRLTSAPHVHPAEHRVVLQVSTNKLLLSGPEQDILKEIVGSRWNVERQELRLTSDQFGSRIENKRHLVSMLDRIVLSSQRLAKETQETPAAETKEII